MAHSLKNRDGLVIEKNDRVTIDGKPATVVGFHREMIRVELDAMPGTPITVDATWKVAKIEE